MIRSRAVSARTLSMCLVLALICVAGCGKQAPAGAGRSSSQAKPAVVIAQVRTDRLAFDPAKSESVAIRFNLSEAADVTLSIHDGRDHRVFHRNAKALPAGDHALTWNGQDDTGTRVPAEAYSYTLTARTAKGSSTHDLTDLTGGQRIEARDVRWDPATGTVGYYLDKPARVNLRIGLEDGPYLRTVVDWVPRQAGAQAERWDGRDASGVLDLAGNPILKPAVIAYTLPDNVLFVGGPAETVRFVAEQGASTTRERQAVVRKQVGNSTQQPLNTRGDVRAQLVPVGDYARDDQGRWIVSGSVPFRVDVADSDRERVVQRRFEAVYYVDGVFTYENELGYLPMTWTWDTSAFNPGEHFVTLNIRGYEGNFGAATVKVLVMPGAPDITQQTGTPVEGK